jgi:hypothetical protein
MSCVRRHLGLNSSRLRNLIRARGVSPCTVNFLGHCLTTSCSSSSSRVDLLCDCTRTVAPLVWTTPAAHRSSEFTAGHLEVRCEPVEAGASKQTDRNSSRYPPAATAPRHEETTHHPTAGDGRRSGQRRQSHTTHAQRSERMAGEGETRWASLSKRLKLNSATKSFGLG